MTIRQTISQLTAQGYSVKYRIRSDGGVIITSINGRKFQGAKGNEYARSLTGQSLSVRRTAQLKKITKERVVKPRKIPIETPLDLERYRKRVMRKWRKAGLTGSISKKNLRKIIEDRGFKQAKIYLEEMERHTEGKAYYGQVDALLMRIEEDMKFADDEEYGYLQQAYDLINANREEMKPNWIFSIFDELYNWEKGMESASAFYVKVRDLLS